MILYAYLRFRFLLWICRRWQHRWLYSGTTRTCQRCGLTQAGSYRRHAGKKERGRRTLQMVRGHFEPDEVAGGQATISFTQKMIKAFMERNRRATKGQ